MKVLEFLFKSPWFILLLLVLPGVLIIVKGLQGGFFANPVEFIQLETGETTVRILLVTLWISPLRMIFPNFRLLKIVVRHRRMMGVSCFVYVLLHFTIYLLDYSTLAVMLENFTRPFIISGALAFLILLAMAITSTNWAVKKMGFKKWKNLHRLVYLAVFLAFLHMFLKEKSNVLVTLLYFIPLLLAEAYRLYNTWQMNQRKLRVQ
jgi:sulfoxide reductase heme-binding subunit YedZ